MAGVACGNSIRVRTDYGRVVYVDDREDKMMLTNLDTWLTELPDRIRPVMRVLTWVWVVGFGLAVVWAGVVVLTKSGAVR